jgi:hypothetical protein
LKEELDGFIDWLKRYDAFDPASPICATALELQVLAERNPDDPRVDQLIGNYLDIMMRVAMGKD